MSIDGIANGIPAAGPPAADGPAAPAVLEVDSVTKTYPSQPPVMALRGVSFTVTQGELAAIVGLSGSGKTTLLHLMGTLDKPTSGTVRIAGTDVAELTDREIAFLRASRIGFVFQQFFLAEHKSLLDNVADGLMYAGVKLALRRELALDALSAVGLVGRADARPTQLSGGQRQRGSTIVLITHDISIARRMPRRIEVLDGRIVADTRGADAGIADTLAAGPPTVQPAGHP